jgi:hypothetical protein
VRSLQTLFYWMPVALLVPRPPVIGIQAHAM